VGKFAILRNHREPLMGFEITPDRHRPITYWPHWPLCYVALPI